MNKLKLAIIGGIAIVILIIFLVFWLLPKGSNNPSPSFSTPTPEALNSSDLYIQKVTPINTFQTYLPVQPIGIVFNKQVKKGTLTYSVSPSVETFVSQGEDTNTLIISPTTVWRNGVTTIIITSAKSIDEKNLKNPQSYKLQIAIPAIPNILGDH